VKQDPSY